MKIFGYDMNAILDQYVPPVKSKRKSLKPLFKKTTKSEKVKVKKVLAKHKKKAVKYDNKTVLCACGCGTWMTRYDKHGNKRRYLKGHFKNRHFTTNFYAVGRSRARKIFTIRHNI